MHATDSEPLAHQVVADGVKPVPLSSQIDEEVAARRFAFPRIHAHIPLRAHKCARDDLRAGHWGMIRKRLGVNAMPHNLSCHRDDHADG